MADDVKVPGLGELPKKYVIGGVIAGGGVAVIVFIRAKKNAAAAAAAQNSNQSGVVTDPAGNTCPALDPNSGYCPGSPEDTSYQENQYAQLAGNGYSGSDYGSYGSATGISTAGLITDPAGNQCSSVNPATGYCPGTQQDIAAQESQTSTTSTGTTTTGGYVTTNAEWVQEALSVLPGGATSANQAALTGVLSGSIVTTAQKNIFLDAVGLIGAPPQGYPAINTSDTSAQGGSTGTASGSSTGGSGSSTSGRASSAPTGLHLTVRGRTGVQVSWSEVGNVNQYVCLCKKGGSNGTVVNGPFTVTAVVCNFGGLQPGTNYTALIWPSNSSDPGGPNSNQPHAEYSFSTTGLWLSGR